MTHRGGATLKTLPHVGRAAELNLLADWLSDVAAGTGGVHIIAGTSGIGKTRLAKAVAERAEREKWSVAIGRVYSVESGVPYAVWSDALVHLLRGMDAGARDVLTRGGDWLGTICPPYARETHTVSSDDRDGKARLLWNFAKFMAKLSEKQPLLLILENLHVADSASLELLHFAARQISHARIALIATYNESELDRNPALRDIEASLLGLSAAKLIRLNPLTQQDVEQLVCGAFSVDHSSARQLARRLYSWTRGHPYFVEETLKSLVDSGRLYERGGHWLGWETEELDTPRSVKSAVSKRLERLSPEARTVAGIAAVIGARLRFALLRDVCELSSEQLLAAIDELTRTGILVESQRADEGDYDFAHAIIQDVIYDSLGLARTRLLHTNVARAIETAAGADALSQADALAFHFTRAEPERIGDKAAVYLAAAGRDALQRHADRAAVDYLSAALERQSPDVEPGSLLEDLAQARQRLGEYDAAMALWQRARADAEAQGDLSRCALLERRLGLACYWTSRFEEALAYYDAALDLAARAGNDAERGQVLLNRGSCYQSLGKAVDAERDLTAALEIAQRLGDQALVGRAHRTLLFLRAFTGPPEASRAHGERALEIARATGDKNIEWSAHWGLATLSGLTGDGWGAKQHVERCVQLADELQSPLMRLYSNEIEMQLAFAEGHWDEGIALAERSIASARAANQLALLPRLLVAATWFYTARGEYDRAKQYLDEAWELAVARAARGRPIEVHSQVAVYAGLAAYYLAHGDYAKAVDIGQQGIAIADRVGYVVWATYRLIPVTAEAAFWKRDTQLARQLRDRMEEEAERLGNRLGMVWIGAGDGLLARLKEDYPKAAELLRKSIEELEKIPWMYDAARLRRWYADVLIRLGDIEAGHRELRKSHEVCAAMGARIELEHARSMMKELGLRLPSREPAVGRRVPKLTERETDIARLVAARKSNKEIAVALGISARTVTTHVANIFSKLGVTSRGELADRMREGLLEAPTPVDT